MKRYPSLPLLLATLMLLPTIHALQITEVMYAPADGNEWVEIYNNDSTPFDLSTLQLKDASSTDAIECCLSPCNTSFEPNTFALIVDKDSTLPLIQTNTSQIFCVDDNSIGNGLGNTADSITVQTGPVENTHILDTMSYGQRVIANSGYTLERTLEGDFTQGFDEGGTPLLPNSVWDLTRAYQGLIINEVLPDPDGSDTAELPQGEWIEVYNQANHEIDLRDLTLQDGNGGVLSISSANTFGSGVIICPNCYSVIYRSGSVDISLNNDADMVYLTIENQIVDTLSFNESTSGLSWSRIETFDEENNSVITWVQLLPSPQEPNILYNTCDYGISLLTPAIIEDPTNYTFEFTSYHNAGQASTVNVTGFLSDLDGYITEELITPPDEYVSTNSTYTFSPRLDPGFYIINLSVNASCPDVNLENNNVQQLIDIIDPEDMGEDVGDFEYWDIVEITPSQVNASEIVQARVVGEVNQESRFWMWAQDEKGKLTPELDFTLLPGPFDITLPFDLKDVCNRGGPASIIMEGRGNTIQTDFTINPTECSPQANIKTTSSKSSSQSNSYHLKETIVQGLQGPTVVGSQSTFETTLTFDAPKGEYDVWAYVYRGSACYSCAQKSINPEDRTYPLTSAGNTALKISLPITLDNIEPGDYEIKVKLLKKGNKTPREFRAPLHVTASTSSKKNTFQRTSATADPFAEEIENSSSASSKTALPTLTKNSGPGIIMYQKDQSTPSEVITLFLAITFALFLAAILFSKSY